MLLQITLSNFTTFVLQNVLQTMTTLKATTSLFHDLRYAKKDGTYPIKLCVIFNRKNRLYKTGFSLSKENWAKLHTLKAGKELKEIRIDLDLILDKVNTIIKYDLPEFSFPAFEKAYFNTGTTKDVYVSYQNYIDKL